MSPVELKKVPRKVCVKCGEDYDTENPNSKYCGACGIAAQVLFVHAQAQMMRWKAGTQFKDETWIREVMGLAR